MSGALDRQGAGERLGSPAAVATLLAMFTGIVEGTGAVLALERRGAGARLRIAAPPFEFAAAAGDSISVSGCCLTVLAAPGADAPLEFDLSDETLQRTWLGALAPGRCVNLERAVRLADRLGGHLVSGHVDGLGRILNVEERGDGGRWIEFEAPPELERYLVPKGSVTVDGVSLTVVEPRGRRFGVAVIPATLERTTLGAAEAGAAVHLEADMLGKWIERLLAAREGPVGA